MGVSQTAHYRFSFLHIRFVIQIRYSIYSGGCIISSVYYLQKARFHQFETGGDKGARIKSQTLTDGQADRRRTLVNTVCCGK
jgi:hypothetical protein